MIGMVDLRIKSKRSDRWTAAQEGKPVSASMINVKLEGPTRVFRPDGKPLCVYLPGLALDVTEQTFEEFSCIRLVSRNRGAASGTERVHPEGRDARGSTAPIASGILGSIDPMGPNQYCRLTAFTAQQVEHWTNLLPYFERIAELLEEFVPERYAAQAKIAAQTNPDWIIPGTPFTTITVNNTYPTGIHTDKGDLDAGFSTLGCMRRGEFNGGWLTFPQYGVAADMQHGDVLLMDAHDWHGNTPIKCARCSEVLRKYDHRCSNLGGMIGDKDFVSPERVSIVSYYRSAMVKCGSLAEETDRRLENRERRNAAKLGLDLGDAEEGA